VQLARINDFFAARKRGAGPFAQAVLGTEGKAQAAGALAEGAVNAVGELFGNKPSAGPDSFTRYVGRCFRLHVLDTGQLQKTIDHAVAGYAGDVRALEGKLLVDLRADLDDAGFDFTRALPAIRGGDAVAGQTDAMISQAIDAAVADFSATIVKFAVSTVIGNAVGDRLTQDGDSGVKKFGVNVAAGMAVDKVLDEAISRAGYDPEGALAAKVTAALDRMRERLMEGNPGAIRNYSILCIYRDSYTDQTIRSACREAADVMERGANLGLRHRLLTLHAERRDFRAATLRKFVLGVGEPPDDTIFSARSRPENVYPPGQILELARECRDFYGARKP
jgi:hypothetical protein